MSNPKTVLELLEKLKAEGVPPEHYGKHYDRFMDYKCREQGIPRHGHFELTPLCNLDCKMCYVHIAHCDRLLPVCEWKKIIKEAHGAGMTHASLTGGECLTYPGFDELYLYLRDMGIQVNVLSNGVLMDADRIAFFKHHPPRLIQITLYGSCDDAYEAVTGKRVFGTVYANLMALKEADLPVKIAITPNRFMVNDMRPLLSLAESTGIPYTINSSLFPPREETGRKKEDLTDEQYLQIFRIQSDFKSRELTPLDPLEMPDEGKCGDKVCGVKCGAGRSGFSVKYDGTMTACISLDDAKAYPLEKGFAEAWKIINAAANCYPRPTECDDCVYAPVCSPCAAEHKNAPELGHCDPRICAHTKLLVREGVFMFPKQEGVKE